jgi:beta-mannosidase
MIKAIFSLLLVILIASLPNAFAQQRELNNWQFRQLRTGRWMKATVPGTVHTDLYNNRMIPDPFFSDNETRLQWIDRADWEYETVFNGDSVLLQSPRLILEFEGLDTYANVYLNGKLLFKADNMFRPWEANIKRLLKRGNNQLKVEFFSALNQVEAIAKSDLPLVLPDNPRVYARKAPFQFGWDWGPKFVGAGIWKPVRLKYGPAPGKNMAVIPPLRAKLVQQKDSAGTSFYFEQNGKPVYIKGANWIPAHIFLPSLTKSDYRKQLLMAKEAGMNMLRVWGGGVYEADAFYELCDSLDIMVWQDFMFAGGMYPGDAEFFKSVKAEAAYQITRLRKYNCIVLWCGNNEIDEAWHHWGWQNQFDLHGEDSAKVWKDYTRLFRDSLKKWVQEFDGKRPYVSTSPQFGWGNPKSYAHGDSHYWGLWWGLEGWEKFNTHTGRFVSEWGMQAMPDYSTVQSYIRELDTSRQSVSVQHHQKANEGFKKLNHYLNQYFFDTTQLFKLSLKEYTYLTQCLQYYILKNSIATHIGKQPYNQGTLLWQLNDCWPVTSWSITDFYRNPKAGFYATKYAFNSMDTTRDQRYPRQEKLLEPHFSIAGETDKGFYISADTDAKYIFIDLGAEGYHLGDNYFNLKSGEKKWVPFRDGSYRLPAGKYTIRSLYDILVK